MVEVVGAAEGALEGARDVVRRAAAPERVRRRRSRLFLLAALASFAGYLFLLLGVRANRQFRADLAATMRLQRRDHPAMARLMSVVSWFGFRPQSLILPASAVAGSGLLRFRLEGLFLGAAWAVSLLSFFTKLFVRRPRPAGPGIRVVQAKIRDTSFPSGHTLHYVSFWGFVTYLCFTKIRDGAPRRVIVAALASLIALVGPSRVYLGHHWLTDVLASYLLGFAYLIGLITLYERIQGRFRPRAGRNR